MRADNGYEEAQREPNLIINILINLTLGAVAIGITLGVIWLATWLYNNNLIILEGMIVIGACLFVGSVIRIVIDA